MFLVKTAVQTTYIIMTWNDQWNEVCEMGLSRNSVVLYVHRSILKKKLDFQLSILFEKKHHTIEFLKKSKYLI